MALQEQLPKTSFLGSTWEGIKGFFKGGIAGMAIGAVIVGGVAAVIGAFAPGAAMSFIHAILPHSADGLITAIAGPVLGTAAGAATQATTTVGVTAGTALLQGVTAGLPVVGQVVSGLGPQAAASVAAKIAVPTISHAAGAGLAAIGGAVVGAGVLGNLGAWAGAFTGVVKSRENAPSAGALMSALNMAHNHGQMVGQQQVVQQLMAAQQQAEVGTRWQDKVAKDQAAKAITQANAV